MSEPDLVAEWRIRVFGQTGEFVVDVDSPEAGEELGARLRHAVWALESRLCSRWQAAGPRMKTTTLVEKIDVQPAVIPVEEGRMSA